jgi:hypothetical protein
MYYNYNYNTYISFQQFLKAFPGLLRKTAFSKLKNCMTSKFFFPQQ